MTFSTLDEASFMMATDTELPDALTTITLERPPDSDFQATVNDYLDYTEYFPSDLIRSLTLIGKLDRDYKDAAAQVHELTALYGDLPTLPPNDRPDPQELRTQISTALEQALTFRDAAYAEATRLDGVADRHKSRLGSIRKKLQALPEPPSRDPTPPPVSPQTTRARKPETEKVPRITLHVDSARRPPGSRPLKHRQMVVPGEVLPPRGPDDEQYTESEEEPAAITEDELGGDSILEKFKRLKTSRPQKLKIYKPPRPRAPGAMGTNVHSSVAGISTSNALAMLTPPPQDALPGSRFRPWFKLTEYEMARLRKHMKKNAVWSPSDTMIRRVLAEDHRGRENYERAKAHAEATGEPMIDEDPVEPNKKNLAPGEVLWVATPGKAEAELVNRGMKLNEAKKHKKELLARQAALEAEKLDEANKQLAELGPSFKNLFNSKNTTPVSAALLSIPGSTRKKDSRANKKRKRDSEKEIARDESSSTTSTTTKDTTIPKKLKLTHSNNIAIAPKPSSRQRALPSPIKTATTNATTTMVPLAPAGSSSSPRSANTRKAKTPAPMAMSPTETKKSPMASASAVTPTAAQSRPRRTSMPPKVIETREATPAVKTAEHEPPREREMRPRSRGNVITGKAASAEPPATKRTSTEGRELREKRRASVVDAHPASDPIAAALTQPRTTRNNRRPAPGLVTTDEDGKGKVSVGKRKAAPKKKGVAGSNANNARKEGNDDSAADDGWDDPVDPKEPRYCLCGDVSYGTMIACENEEVPLTLTHAFYHFGQ
jgi:hypothetical protein